jgi:hypothetical protein
MFKRLILTMTFLATLAAVGVGVTERADAWGRWRRPYVSYYYDSPSYYYDGYVPYRTYYRGYWPGRVYRPYYRSYSHYYGYPDYYYYDRPVVSFSIGF